VDLAERKRRAVVDKLDLVDVLLVVLDQYVLGLEVAVHDLRLAQQLQGLRHLNHNLFEETRVVDNLVIQRLIEDLT